MSAITYLLIGGVGLLVLWAYRRHALDDYLGLDVPHGTVTPAVTPTIKADRTKKPYGPTFDGSTIVTTHPSAPSGPIWTPSYWSAVGKIHGDGGARDPQTVTGGSSPTDGMSFTTGGSNERMS